MLKITSVFGLIFVTVAMGAPPKKVLVDLPPPVAQVIIESARGCVGNMDLSELLAMVREGRLDDKPEFKKIISCAFVASGFSSREGKVFVDRTLPLFAGKEEAQKAIIECAKTEGPTPDDSIYNFYKCFQLKSPYTINLHL